MVSHEGHTPPTQRGSAGTAVMTLGASAAPASLSAVQLQNAQALPEQDLRSSRFVAALSIVLADDKEGENCEFEKHLPEANVVITTPFW